MLAGCTKNIDTPEAVKQGVIKDIAKKVDVGNMDVTVESVSFRGKEATATIAFKPRGGDPKQAITMSYSMEKQGDEWHVKARDMERHQAVQPGVQLPPGHMGSQGEGQMPPGHPATGGQQLPPGHPPAQ